MLRLWRADLDVPFAGEGDAIANTALVKALVDHGGWTHNPDLGFPFGQDLHDFAMGGDHVHLALLWLFGHLAGSPGGGLNLTFLAGLALSAVTAFAVLRALGAGRPPSVACAVLFALAPSAFLRGETHILLAAWPVPVGVWLALRAWGGEPLPRGRRARLLGLAACALVASTGSFYFPAFTLALVVAGAAVHWALHRDRRALAAAAATVAAIGAVSAVNLLPTALYALEHGRNEVVAARFASESEFHGLKLAQLLLPVQGHRLAPLAELRARYEGTGLPPAPAESYWSTLGLVASAGLLWLLAVLLAGGRARIDERHRRLAGCALVALLIGTTGGLGAIFAYVVSPQLRGWNRISVFLAFLALAAVALLLDAAARRVRRPLVVAAGLAGVVGIGLLDQTSDAFVPPYAALEARHRSDARFVAAIEARTPPGAAVLQLPAVPFPEPGPVRGIADYEPLRGYLHATRLRWSHGAMKGRPEDWQSALAERPLAAVLASARAVGFAGLWVDRAGLEGEGRAVERELATRLGTVPLVSPDGRFSFWALPPAPAAPGARAATLRPLRLSVPGTEAQPLYEGGNRWGVRTPVLRVLVDNPSRTPRRARLRLTVRRRAADPAPVEVVLPGGRTRRLVAGLRGATLEQPLVVPPGRSAIELRTGATPAADWPGGPALTYTAAASLTDEVLLAGSSPARR